MTTGGALAVIIVGLLISAFLSSTIGFIVAALGVVGLVLSLLTGASRTRAA